MVDLFPDDRLARKIAGLTFIHPEFLVKRVRHSPPPLQAKAIVHADCHQKAVIGMGDEVALLGAMGVDFELLDTGCCGMAGSFGFDKDKPALSMHLAELIDLAIQRQVATQTPQDRAAGRRTEADVR